MVESGAMEGPDKRKHPRHQKSAPLILLEKTTFQLGQGAILRDVSIGGLAFETELDLKAGDSFEFALYVPTRGWVDGKGTIAWTKPLGKTKLCGASIDIREWDQQRLLEKWLSPQARGVLKYFFPEPGTKPPDRI